MSALSRANALARRRWPGFAVVRRLRPLSLPRRRPGRRAVAVAAGVLAVLAVLWVVGCWQLFRSAEAKLVSARAYVTALQPSQLTPDHVRAARDLAAGARDDLWWLRVLTFVPASGLRLAGYLPSVGPLLAAPPALLDLGYHTVDGLASTAAGLQPAADLFLADGAGSRQDVQSAAAALRAGQPDFARAHAALARAAEARRALDAPALVRVAPGLAASLAGLDAQLPRLRFGVAALFAAPDLLGVDGPRTYLLLGQTEDELRATGGFVGSAGVVTFEHGRLREVDYRSSYEVDLGAEPLPPPQPLAEYLGFGGWYFRDANWFADFPTSARWARWFWERHHGKPLAGVVAFDQELVRAVLAVVGPVYVPAFGEQIGAHNFKSRTLYWLYQGQTSGPNPQFTPGAKTSFVKSFGEALVQRLSVATPDQLAALVGVAEKALAERHLTILLDDPAVAPLLAENRWDGRLQTPSGDYLAVVDTTASYSKLAPIVDEQLDYEVRLRPDGAAQVRLTVAYANKYDAATARGTYPLAYLGEYWSRERRRVDFLEGYYASYLRVYTPLGSLFGGSAGFDSPADRYDETGKRVFAAYLSLRSGERRQTRLEYEVPAAAIPSDGALDYRLYVQKQPGTEARPFTLRVLPPEGWTARLLPPGATYVDRPSSPAATRPESSRPPVTDRADTSSPAGAVGSDSSLATTTARSGSSLPTKTTQSESSLPANTTRAARAVEWRTDLRTDRAFSLRLEPVTPR
ncbi:MAG: DUF4012 domain-containing protein [Chloroflexi bacterium]|nr:DUF4012 domain-containing protein [Chloroflexota bacterium]